MMDQVTIDAVGLRTFSVCANVRYRSVFIHADEDTNPETYEFTPTQAQALIAALQQAVREVEGKG